MPKGRTGWGDDDHYYASITAPDGKEAGDKAFLDALKKLLDQHDRDLKQRVERAQRQWNLVLRDHLRNEMGLRLSAGEDSRAVPIRIVTGLPRPLSDLLQGIDPRQLGLLLHLPLLEATVSGLEVVERKFDSLQSLRPRSTFAATPKEIHRVRETVEEVCYQLDQLKLLSRIAGIQQDVLGAYFYRVPEIQIYWMAIGVVAAVLGITVESLAVVVLLHELAHAYSHLGRDIDGEHWATDAFSGADLPIVEGIAQHYTETICAKLRSRLPSAAEAFEKVLLCQSEPYGFHKTWRIEDGARGEVVRVSMIECRARRLTDYRVFLQVLDAYGGQLSKRRGSRT